ncbi:Peptidase family M1 containing protein [Aphelenchoides fujianensis]|nr:Peptidase family M1 containing protein [Aphelenchoides fujianensis]
MADDLLQFQTVVSELAASPNEDSREAAQKAGQFPYSAITIKQRAELLLQCCVDASINNVTRSSALTLFGLLFSSGYKQFLNAVGHEAKTHFYEQFIAYVSQEEVPVLQQKLREFITEIARNTINETTAKQKWTGVMQFLKLCATSEKPALREVGMQLIENFPNMAEPTDPKKFQRVFSVLLTKWVCPEWGETFNESSGHARKHEAEEGDVNTDFQKWREIVGRELQSSAVPVLYSILDEVEFCCMFNPGAKKLALDAPPATEWLQMDEFFGFFRVQYPDGMLERLMKAVQAGQLNALDRFNFAKDLYALVKSGRASAAQFLALYGASGGEDEFIVWSTLDGGVRALLNVLEHHEPELKPRLEKFVQKTLAPVIRRLGFEAEEDPHRSMLRGLVFSTLSKVGHEETTRVALQKFDEFVTKQTPIPNDLRNAVFCVVGRHRPDGVEQLRKVYEKCGSAEIRRDTLYGLQQTPDREQRERNFESAVVQGNEFVQKTFDSEALKGFARVLEQTVESIRLNEQLAEKHIPAIKSFLPAV